MPPNLPNDDFWRDENVLLGTIMLPLIQEAGMAGATAGMTTLRIAAVGMSYQQVNRLALEEASRYGYGLITNLTNNSRKRTQAQIAQWIEAGETMPDLRERLRPIYGSNRARMIATTEVTRLYAQGNQLAWEESGMVAKKRWQTVRDQASIECPICGPLHGETIPLSDKFPGQGPPAHVQCRCWVTPVLDESVAALPCVARQLPLIGKADEGPTDEKDCIHGSGQPGTFVNRGEEGLGTRSHGCPTKQPGTTTSVLDDDAITDMRNAQRAFLAQGLEDIDGWDQFGLNSVNARARVKEGVSCMLENRTGIHRNDTSEFVRQWAKSSNDANPTSLRTQQAVAGLFDGAEMSVWQRERLEALGDATRSVFETRVGVLKEQFAGLGYANADEAIDAVVHAIYSETQHRLAVSGIDDLVLYRGVIIEEVESFAMAEGVGLASGGDLHHMVWEESTSPAIRVTQNAASSWSSEIETARDFAKMELQDGQTGIVLEMRVPRERVFSSARTGLGCLNEEEFILLGGAIEDTASVVSAINLDDIVEGRAW